MDSHAAERLSFCPTVTRLSIQQIQIVRWRDIDEPRWSPNSDAKEANRILVVMLGDRSGEGFNDTTFPPLVELMDSASPDYRQLLWSRGVAGYFLASPQRRDAQIACLPQRRSFVHRICASRTSGLVSALERWLHNSAGLVGFGPLLWAQLLMKPRVLWRPHQTRILLRSHRFVMHTATPNQTLERTADRRENLLSMTSTRKLKPRRAVVSDRSARSR
jgi:hypothetical protein